MTSPLERALAGMGGPELQKLAEDLVDKTVDQMADICGRATIIGGEKPPKGLFASGGAVKAKAPFMVGNGDREHFVPIASIPTPAPTRIVELPGLPTRGCDRVKGVIDAALSEGG